MPPAEAIERRIQELPLSDVIPTPDNKRKIDPKSADIQELAQSIREVGILSPVLVRPHPEKKGKWDLRAGHRRHVAAGIAGLTTVPAIVVDLDDRRAAEITTVENLQREDLTPIEEAEQLQVMIDAGWDVEACAISIGKDLAWVHSRARLSKLIPEWKEGENREGEQIHEVWSVAHLELIARYPEDVQRDLLELQNAYWGPLSLTDLRRAIGDRTNELGKASFKPEDAELIPEVGACSDCPKRRGARPDLFLEIGPSIPLKEDVCLDPECWAQKTRVHAERILEQAKEKDERTVPVRKTWSGYQVPTKQNHYGTDYKPAKKTEKGAIPAVVMDGEGQIGRKVWVKPTSNGRAATGTPDPATGRVKKTLAEKKAQKKQQRLRHARDAAKTAIGDMATPDLDLSWFAIMAAVGTFERREPSWSAARFAQLNENDDALKDELWRRVRYGILTSNLFLDWKREFSPTEEKEIAALCEQLSLKSWDDLKAEAEAALPDPKSWAKEEAAAKANAAVKNGKAKTKKARTKKTKKAKSTKKTKRTRKAKKPATA